VTDAPGALEPVEEKESEAASASSGHGEVYRKLIAMGKLSVPTNRFRLYFAGEGRNGKTSTRKALTGRPFDPGEASTRGTAREGVELLNLHRTEACGWTPQLPCSVQYKRAIASLIAGVMAGTSGGTIEDLRAMGIEHSLLGKIKEKADRRKAKADAAAAAAAAAESPPATSPTPDALGEPTEALDVPGTGDAPVARDAAAAVVQPAPAPKMNRLVPPVPELDEEMEALLTEYLESPSMAQPLNMQMWDFGGERRAPPSSLPILLLGRCPLDPSDIL